MDIQTGESLIPIAFATDENYIVPTLVAFKSAVINTNSDNKYIFFILVEKDVSDAVKKMFLSVIDGYPYITLNFLIVGHLIGKVNIFQNGPVKGVSLVTYYRFLLPDLLPEYDKALYIDTDTIIKNDVAQIYEYNMNDAYVAGVRDIVEYQNETVRCKELSIDSLHTYINAGVILLNLKKLRDTNLAHKMLKVASTSSFPYNDQDIINSLCYGYIAILPFRCNVILDYLSNPSTISEVLNIDYEKETKQPIILHFAGRSKPWYTKDVLFASQWWDVALSLESPIFKREFRKFMHLVRKKHHKKKRLKIFVRRIIDIISKKKHIR